MVLFFVLPLQGAPGARPALWRHHAAADMGAAAAVATAASTKASQAAFEATRALVAGLESTQQGCTGMQLRGGLPGGVQQAACPGAAAGSSGQSCQGGSRPGAVQPPLQGSEGACFGMGGSMGNSAGGRGGHDLLAKGPCPAGAKGAAGGVKEVAGRHGQLQGEVGPPEASQQQQQQQQQQALPSSVDPHGQRSAARAQAFGTLLRSKVSTQA